MHRVSTLARAMTFAAIAAAFPGRMAHAQGGVLLQGVFDLELWKTNGQSALLARNDGRLGPVARGDVWTAVEPFRDIVAFAEVMGETGSGRDEPGSEVYARQFGVRYAPSDAFTITAGRVPQVVGAFSARQLSFRNPLIGVPDGYATAYPNVLRVDGTRGMVDYRAGLVDLPFYRPGYVPEPSRAVRPAIGIGITPVTGFRIGASGTVGSYLNDGLGDSLLAGQPWTAYKQRIAAAELQFSHGYFDANAELAWSSYDVPGKPATKGVLYYVEPRYTFSPRVFVAARYERNYYPFIAPRNSGWISSHSDLSDVELGLGFRATPATLLKVSVRGDHWAPNPNPGAPQANGTAVAVQWSQLVDFMELAARR